MTAKPTARTSTRRATYRLLLTVAVLLALAGSAAAQMMPPMAFYGYVKNAAGEAVPTARVEAYVNGALAAQTNASASGGYRLNVPGQVGQSVTFRVNGAALDRASVPYQDGAARREDLRVGAAAAGNATPPPPASNSTPPTVAPPTNTTSNTTAPPPAGGPPSTPPPSTTPPTSSPAISTTPPTSAPSESPSSRLPPLAGDETPPTTAGLPRSAETPAPGAFPVLLAALAAAFVLRLRRGA